MFIKITYKSRANKERGVGNVMVFAGVAIAAVAWFVLSTVLTIVGNSHHKQQEADRQYFANQQPKKQAPVRREVRGYQLSY